MKNPPARSRVKLTVFGGAIVIAVILDVLVVSFAFRHFYGADSAFQMLLIWSLGWLSPTALLALFIYQLLKHQHALLAQVICLIAVTVNLILIFAVCPMDLAGKPKGFEHNPPSIDPKSSSAMFLIEENKKAVEEIKNRDDGEDNWFHYKFILVGGLLAATMGYIGFGPRAKQSVGQQLTELSRSPSTGVILALASVMVLGVDMHIRRSSCVTDQLGLWIRYYVEPVLLHGNPGNELKSLPEDFYGWEEFLRVKVKTSRSTDVASGDSSARGMTEKGVTTNAIEWDYSVGGGLHSDELSNLFYEPENHFLTVFVYILYLAVFQTFASRTAKDPASGGRIMPTICFVVVQISFLAFAWVAHSAPEMFELRVLPFVAAYEAGYLVPLHYFVPCLAIVFLNMPYVVSYWQDESN